MVDFFSQPFVVKVCGMTSTADAEDAIAAGADAIGVIVCSSTRRVDAATAREITTAVAGRAATVVVVRSDEPESVEVALAGVGADLVQVHGELTPDVRARLRSAGLGVIKVLAIGEPGFGDFDDAVVDALIFDGAQPGRGVEHSFVELLSRPFARPVIAAGGLTPESVAKVVKYWDVWGVDVATGVESAPGVKDAAKVGAFVAAARAAFDEREADRG
ncbi:MAG: phosphoribosylanthranilate isomerase [Acidimicrobiales bacterium]